MMSKMRMAFAASLIGFAALAGGGSVAHAATVGSVPLATISEQAQTAPTSAEPVHYRGHRHACAHRWGRKTRGFYRCLNRHRHFQPVRHYCKATRHECADRWGWRTGRYYRCVRNHGC
jgi:hypothetical protein